MRRSDVDRLIGTGLTRDQERSLWLHHAVAGELVRDPERVLGKANDGLERLRVVHVDGPVVESLGEWGRILSSGSVRVLEALTSRSGWAVELRQNSPFAGVLSEGERAAVLRAFSADWRRRRAA